MHVNTLLFMLNARETIRDAGSPGSGVSFPVPLSRDVTESFSVSFDINVKGASC